MQDRIARVVHDVLDYGLELKQRVANGKPGAALSIQSEQQRLITLLNGDNELNFNKDYAGDAPAPNEAMTDPRLENRFLGIKYALVCWLDEIFIKDSPLYWQRLWTESTLEEKIWKGTQQRAWRFWTNAVKASAEGRNSDALEVYLWCVLLGFRGDPSAEPRIGEVPDWIQGVKRAIIANMPRDFPLPTDREATSNVPPLYYRERFGRMLTFLFLVILTIAAVVVVMVFKQ